MIIDVGKEVKEHLSGRFIFLILILFLISFAAGFSIGIGYGVNQCIDFGLQVMQKAGIDLTTYKPSIVDLFNKYQGRTGIILNEADSIRTS